ncbi:MAG: hypothetical protein N2170_01080 [Bacteroidia bacterium]|nr:hypothetical protein [Bacteroidia bacterium]
MFQVCTVAGFQPWEWRRVFQVRELPPTLFWSVASDPTTASRVLTAILSEKGVVVRWLPLRHRGKWIEEALSLPWSETSLAFLFSEVPCMVLDADPCDLQRLWRRLREQGYVSRTYFVPSYFRSALTQEPRLAQDESELEEWALLYEELREDLSLARAWLPCILTTSIA